MQPGGMLTRLADVLYWAACVTAGGIVAFALWALPSGGSIFRMQTPDDGNRVIVLGFAILVWLVGWAIRYVLGGR